AHQHITSPIVTGLSPVSLRLQFRLLLVAMLLLCFGMGQANDSATGRQDGKSLQQSVFNIVGTVNAQGGDLPDPLFAVAATASILALPGTRLAGTASSFQFNPMVLQLRDRLMHAPPFNSSFA